MRKAFLAAALAAATALSGGIGQAEETRYPLPEPGVVGELAAITPCTAESEYDVPSYYGDACKRLKITFGPIVVNPGKNDVLIQPVSFEKPMWDGYMVRFKPGLVDATGMSPKVEQLHLHHGTWLNTDYFGYGRQYGWGPWLATGEEKTIAAAPYRYGLKIQGDDVWLFLHMVHSAVAQPMVVWATYDIDYIAVEKGDVVQPDGKPLITNTKGIWLDVGTGGGEFGIDSQGRSYSNDDPYSFNPVYNVQTGFGASSEGTLDEFKIPASEAQNYGLGDEEVAIKTCAWPAENCARENSSGRVSLQQGNTSKDAEIQGWNWKVPAAAEGSLVMMGGHLHMGGTNDTVSLVRKFEGPDGQTREFSKIIHISDAYYWNWQNAKQYGAVPTSWDVSMSGTTSDLGWKVIIRAGDKLRLNAVYDTDIGSWYENMGIVMTWVAPQDFSGVDPFRGCTWTGGESLSGCEVAIKHGLLPDRAVQADARPTRPDEVYNADGSPVLPRMINRPEAAPGWSLPGADLAVCNPSPTTLCTRGQITHGHFSTSGNHNGCVSTQCSSSLLDQARAQGPGQPISEIHMTGFTYGLSDFNVIGLGGIPRVALGDEVTFINDDVGLYIPHTATLCAYPCTGPTTTNYPIADGARPVVRLEPEKGDDSLLRVDEVNGSRTLDSMDFDTTELGVNIGATQVLEYALKTTRTGIFTYFCRIHPAMRGAFEVFDPTAS